MKKMLDWLTRFIWISEIIFLAASTPHIATYFEHFDNPTDILGTVYAWSVGYGLALTIDGVSFVVLMSVIFAVKYQRPRWLITFLVFSLLLISALSWFINWQYDIVFSSSTFTQADSIITFNGLSIGTLNPLIGGAFPLLSVLYALVAKAIEVDESALTKTVMTPEQFENERIRIEQEQQLKVLRRSYSDGKGLLSLAQETVMGRSRSADELLENALNFLRDAHNLLSIESEEEALEALSGYLKISAKNVRPILLQSRAIIQKEDDDMRLSQEKAEHEARLRREKEEEEARLIRAKIEEETRLAREKAEHEAEMERARLELEASLEKARLEHEQTMIRLSTEREERERLAREAEELRIKREKTEEEERIRQRKLELEAIKSQASFEEDSLLEGLQGSDTVPLETAAIILGYDDRYIVRLRNEGKLKHASKRPDRITVASLRAYQATHNRRRKDAASKDAFSNGHRPKDTQPLDNLVPLEI